MPRLRRVEAGPPRRGIRAIPVDDPADPRLADFFALRDADLRAKVEWERGTFIAEGELVVRELLRSPYRVKAVLVTPRKLAALADDLTDALPADAPVYVASRPLLRHVVGFDLHRGAVAAAERPAPVDVASLVERSRALLVVENVSDVENMGSLFRNASAFGADAVLLSPGCCDPLYRRAVRVSMGHVLRVPFAPLPDWPGALESVVRRAGFTIAALTPRSAARSLDEMAADGPADRPAILVGAEGAGLTDGALAAADVAVRIPMRPGVDSVNVATAAAIALHRLVPAR